jgi:N-carbamoyl-L-amino-acid hydrolase
VISRREFLGGMAAVAWQTGRPLPGPPDLRDSRAPRIDAGALRSRIERLSTFGRPAGGSFASGVSRIAYSDADVEGRGYVMGLMRSAGLQPRIDPAGNIFAIRRGTESSLPPILFGSHIDSVPNGGNFDGDLGSLSALAAMEALDAAGIRTSHALEMVVWARSRL